MTLEDFEHTARHLRPKIHKMAYRFFQNTEDAEDVEQEILMRLWMRAESLDPEGAEKLAVIATKNLCVSMLRLRKGKNMLPVDENISIEDGVQPDSQMRAEDCQTMLEKAIGMLTNSERRLVLMVQQEELNTREISIITGIQIRSVRTMLSAARKKILKQLTQWNNH